jgi:hypothetical protein
MGLERWLYERLNSPAITVLGNVQTDLFEKEPSIDWINGRNLIAENESGASIGRVLIRGGCEMQAIAHFFALDAEQLETEFQFDRGGLPVPIHHSVFLRSAIEGISASDLSAAASLGYQAADFESHAAERSPSIDMYVYSFWADGHYAIYRDRETSIRLPFGIHGLNNGTDLRRADAENLRPHLTEPGMEAKMEALRQRFDYMTWSPGIREASGETMLEHNLSVIFNVCRPQSKIFVLLGCERVYDVAGFPQPVPHLMELNRITRRAAEGRPHVHLLAPDDFITLPSDVIDATHWDRRVYYRIYQRIVQLHRG